MANFYTGKITVTTTPGSQSFTGFGFQPKAVFFWSTTRSAETAGDDAYMAIGFATSSSARWAASYFADWNNVTSDANRSFHTDKCMSVVREAAATNMAADFTSMDADGITINVTTAPSGNRDWYVMAWGGSDISVKVGTFNTNTSTGSQSVTGVGFQPSLVFFGSTLSDTTTGYTATGRLTIGAALSSSNEFNISLYSQDNVADTNTAARQVRTSSWSRIDSTTVLDEFDFTSMDSDGFTFNLGTTAGAAITVGYFAIAGLDVAMGTFDEATSTGNQTVTGVGFTPQALMLFSKSKASSTTIDADANITIGAGTSSSARNGASITDPDAQATSRPQRIQQTTKILQHLTGTASTGAPTVNADIDLVSFGSGEFTYEQETADATSRRDVYIAFATTAAGTNTSSMLEVF